MKGVDSVRIGDLKVRIFGDVYAKMAGWCKATNLETTSILFIRKQADTFTIYDAHLPKQKGTCGHTDMDPEYLMKYKMALMEHNPQKAADWRGWGHTHPTFEPFWSGTDEDTARRLSKQAGDWHISIVHTQKDTYRCRLDIHNPFELTIDDIEMEFLPARQLRWTNWKYQVEQKLIKEPPVIYQFPPSVGGYDYGRWPLSYDYSQYDKKNSETIDKPSDDALPDWVKEYNKWNKERKEREGQYEMDLAIRNGTAKEEVPPEEKEEAIIRKDTNEGGEAPEGGSYVCYGGNVISKKEFDEMMLRGLY